MDRAHRDVDGRIRNFYRIFPAAGGEPMATFLPPGPSSGFEWLPDGSGLVHKVVLNGIGNIWLQPVDGGEARQLTRFDRGLIGDIDVSPDGTHISLNRLLDGVGNLWMVNVDGSAPTALSEFLVGQVFDMAWSRDSKNVILIQGEVRREVVLLTDVGQ